MSLVCRPKKDKKKLLVIDAFGLPGHSNQQCNLQNEVYVHLHVTVIVDVEKEIIISMIENMYFVAIHDLSLKCIIQYVTLNSYK